MLCSTVTDLSQQKWNVFPLGKYRAQHPLSHSQVFNNHNQITHWVSVLNEILPITCRPSLNASSSLKLSGYQDLPREPAFPSSAGQNSQQPGTSRNLFSWAGKAGEHLLFPFCSSSDSLSSSQYFTAAQGHFPRMSQARRIIWESPYRGWKYLSLPLQKYQFQSQLWSWSGWCQICLPG